MLGFTYTVNFWDFFSEGLNVELVGQLPRKNLEIPLQSHVLSRCQLTSGSAGYKGELVVVIIRRLQFQVENLITNMRHENCTVYKTLLRFNLFIELSHPHNQLGGGKGSC